MESEDGCGECRTGCLPSSASFDSEQTACDETPTTARVPVSDIVVGDEDAAVIQVGLNVEHTIQACRASTQQEGIAR